MQCPRRLVARFSLWAPFICSPNSSRPRPFLFLPPSALSLSLSLSLSDRTIPTSLSSSSFSTSKRICQTSEPFCFARPEWEREKAGREKGEGRREGGGERSKGLRATNERTTEMRFNLCTWFGEVSSCSSLTVLPGTGWVLLNKICKN